MLKLGIIGMSPGNGHPYSWSAIINGVSDWDALAQCGYSGIPLYLKANQNTLGIDGARVTHIWVQDRTLAQHIARAAGIEKTVANMEDMIGQVDAVILARDDPENHVAMSRPFLDADIPLFIDKPLAITRPDLLFFDKQVRAGKFLMSCSSMRYASENSTIRAEMPSLGQIELVVATGKKDWPKYGVHMLEAIFALLDDPQPVTVTHFGTSDRHSVHITVMPGIQIIVNIFARITPTFQITVFASEGWRLIEYKNWYAMFRTNLEEFIRSVRENNPRLPFASTRNIINVLIGAQESFAADGRTICIDPQKGTNRS